MLHQRAFRENALIIIGW